MAIRSKYNSPHSTLRFIVDESNNRISLESLHIRIQSVRWIKLFETLCKRYKARHWEVVIVMPERLYRIRTEKEKIIQDLYQKRYPVDWEARFKRSKKRNRFPNEIWVDYKKVLKEMDKWYAIQRSKFEQLEAYYDSLELQCSNIHIHKEGIQQVDPYKRRYRKEKGLDLAIAVKVKEAADDLRVEAVVLASGDGDFVQTLKKAKNRKPFYLIEYLGNGVKGASMSWALRNTATEVISISKDQLQDKFSGNGPLQKSVQSYSRSKSSKRPRIPINPNSLKPMPKRNSPPEIPVALAS